MIKRFKNIRQSFLFTFYSSVKKKIIEICDFAFIEHYTYLIHFHIANFKWKLIYALDNFLTIFFVILGSYLKRIFFKNKNKKLENKYDSLEQQSNNTQLNKNLSTEMKDINKAMMDVETQKKKQEEDEKKKKTSEDRKKGIKENTTNIPDDQ